MDLRSPQTHGPGASVARHVHQPPFPRSHPLVLTPSQSAWRIIRSLVVGYIEAKDPDEPAAAMEDQPEEEEEEKLEPLTAGRSAAAPIDHFRAAGKAVMLNNRQRLGGNNLASHESHHKQMPAPKTSKMRPRFRPKDRG